ncbi:ABC transporter ATP-binding protein [Puniceibacterium sp. IMCC21224]|uniref:ABC transporter ATP-binding protein n=1 Tax=Puniceibacterium sp. IMCC21224 TaxID=1618204 RepID=UPI00064D79B0|nr:ABC transporter ATP-binding protein [Puniceibacterium sp. IMCC21224]KMK64899.1 oligopeptide/dipeptide ABC transporter, ATP-binding protein [Puniceibacterium sp. IMCC21224]
MTLLVVEDLHTHFISRDIDNRERVAKALNGVSFSLEAGRILGIVGETGAGKSLTAQSVVGLLRPPAKIVSGSVRFDGRELTTMPSAELNRIRGAGIAMVVQNPRTSLDPLTRVGDQLVRLHQIHSRGSREASRKRALEMMEAVGIPDPTSRARSWPHELSGGMAQRVLLAMALMNAPKLLIADEPTTGLDVTVQAQILDLLRDLVTRFDMATMIITHDLGVVAHFCDEIAVMFGGSIVESGPVADVFATPVHPYTRNLIGATPERFQMGGAKALGGQPPDLYNLPPGCALQSRCAYATEICRMSVPNIEVTPGHFGLCHFAGTLKSEPAEQVRV